MNNTETMRYHMVKQNSKQSLETAIAEKKIYPLMVPISKFLFSTENYFSTSTCSGRITLMDLAEKETKKENAFYRKWHRPVTFTEVWEGIEEYTKKGNLWLRQDAFVYVIGANTLEHARKLFHACQEAGVKRYGIHHFEEGKVLLEVFGTQNMSVPVIIKGKVVTEKKSVHEYVKIANAKWKLNEEKRKAFEKVLRKRLK